MKKFAFIVAGICWLLLLATPELRGQETPNIQEPASRPATLPSSRAAHVIINNEIDTYVTRSAERDILAAKEKLGADVIILEITTNGGAVGAALDFARFLKQQQDLRIIALVRDKAYSAGSLIALAADEIHMAPGSAIGDCAPIMIVPGAGLEPLPDAERAKIESPILADFRDSATRNGYDPLMAQSMVQAGIVVHYIEKDGQRRFVNAEDYTKLTAEGWTAVPGVPNPLDAKDTLLTVYDDVAKTIGLSRSTVASAEALAAAQGLEIVATYRPTMGDAMIALLSSGVVRTLLMSAVAMSLYFSLSAPGQGLPETVLVVSLGLLLGIPAMTGYAQWYEIAAVLLGIALLAVELFVLPGFGVAGITGILLIIGGLVMTFVPAMPQPPADWPPGTWTMPGDFGGIGSYVLTALVNFTIAMFIAVIGCAVLSKYITHIPLASRLILTTTAGTPVALDSRTDQSIWPAVGTTLTALTDLRPGGNARWDNPATATPAVIPVVSDSGFAKAGATLIVREITGNRAVVRAVDEPPTA